MKKTKLVCKECGSSNIEVKAWINPNTDKVLDSVSDEDIKDNWCNECSENVMFEKIEVEDEQRKL